jgi:selenocysteine-specific elongation factor
VEGPLHVVATAGHVDHGKSSLLIRLTGMDPDRWAEEKRRGLTIDLGFAWTSLPSGREVGFVDVPGHERFVRNMLAGVGPVRLVLFVVAADEGWKPQSEEHLEIVDVLGAHAGVIALTKIDLVDRETAEIAEEEVRERLIGTVLERSPIVRCSSVTGRGLDELRAALDSMVETAPLPEDQGRPRIDIDRSFTIRGAGTVVTGTLTGGTLTVGDEVTVHPSGLGARIRSLQTHRRPVTTARPVSRVAANLAATSRDQVARGDVLARPGQWRPTSTLEVSLRPVRSIDHPLGERGAYKLHVGSAERDARLRLYGARQVGPGDRVYGRLRLSLPIVAAVGDRFVLREAGRRETVAGGSILDPMPPARPGSSPEERLGRREMAPAGSLPLLLVQERGRVRTADVVAATGSEPDRIAGAQRLGRWWVADEVAEGIAASLTETLAAFHRAHPLRVGMDDGDLRRSIGPDDVAGAMLERLRQDGVVVREGTAIRLASHQVDLGDREPEARRLVEAVAAGEPTPPTARELQDAGFSPDLVQACVTTGRLVRASPEILVTPEFARTVEEVALMESAGAGGLTVSRFRERLGTSRKYAVPLLEWLDARGVTRRDGDVRRPGASAP